MDPKLSGVVFDFNGTLFWDTPLHIDAWMEYCAIHSVPLTLEDFYAKVYGKTNEDIFAILFDGKLSPETVQAEAEVKERMYREICVRKGQELAPGAEDFLNSLQERGIPFTIATASPLANVEFFYDYARLDRWFQFEDLVWLDGTVVGKPDPAMYLKAMQIIGQKPENVLIFEDSPPGIQAAMASKAGDVILVNSEERDYSRYPYRVIRDFSEVADLEFYRSADGCTDET